MRKLVFLLTFAAALAVSQSALAATNVSITKSGFYPATLTVAAGETVTWTNGDTARHQVVADNGSFSSPVLAANQSYSHRFGAGGTFRYRDALHPSLRGTLNVVPVRTVWITNAGFVPGTIAIKAGQSIRWVNRTSSNQQIVADDSSFSSSVLAPGAAFSHTFGNAGIHRYHDGLQPSLTGTVTVAAVATESISLTSTRQSVTYGGSVTLTGQVANGVAGQRVTLTVSPQAGKIARSIETTTAGSDGSFRFTVTPLVQTAYTVAGATSTSAPIVINVRPRIRLGRLSHHRVVVRVSTAASFVGHRVYVQRWAASRGVWVTVRRARLARATLGASPTVVTSATLRVRFRHHVRVRVFMPRSQTAPGYTSNASNSVRI